MKKIYSVILLFSFLTGVLQPVMPMIEYQLHKGNLIEFFSSGKPCDMAVQIVKDDCGDHQEQTKRSLLDDDFYPLAIQLTIPPKPIAVPNKKKLEIFVRQNISDLAYSPNPPPPRLS